MNFRKTVCVEFYGWFYQNSSKSYHLRHRMSNSISIFMSQYGNIVIGSPNMRALTQASTIVTPQVRLKSWIRINRCLATWWDWKILLKAPGATVFLIAPDISGFAFFLESLFNISSHDGNRFVIFGILDEHFYLPSQGVLHDIITSLQKQDYGQISFKATGKLIAKHNKINYFC